VHRQRKQSGLPNAIPGARLRVLEHSSHLSPIEEPAAFFEALEYFLAATSI